MLGSGDAKNKWGMAVAFTYIKVFDMHFIFVIRWGKQGQESLE